MLPSTSSENKLIKVFNNFGNEYLKLYKDRMPLTHLKAFRDIEQCRTIKHGMIEIKCEECKRNEITFGACRNRACPKCNKLKNQEWILSRCNKLPNVAYYHIVFTVPDVLRYLARRNQNKFYSALFYAVHNTLHAFSESKEWVQGKTGYMSVLHTWDNTLNIHPHVHVLFLGGFLNEENKWVEINKTKVFPNEAMACRFKTILLKTLRNEFNENIPSSFWNTKWIVYTKKAIAGDTHVIEYLGAYVKRIAISSSRIVSVNCDTVTFLYRHREGRNNIKAKRMSLPGQEFLRRYMQHILPANFVRVRYYGLMHSALTEELNSIKTINGASVPSERYPKESTERTCSKCKKPIQMTMVVLPYYLKDKNKINNLQRMAGNFYNKEQYWIDGHNKLERTTSRSS